MLKELQDFGLSEKEAHVYLAALEIGRATADQLAKHSKIVRSTTYVQLDSLMKMGLMSTYEEGKKTYFAPESPELLKRLLLKQKEEMNTKEQELSALLPALLQQFEGAGERPVVRFFSSKEGITAMRENALKELKKGEVLHILYSYDELQKLYSKEELFDFSTRRESKGIVIKSIYSKVGEKFKRSTVGLKEDERRYIAPERLPLKTDFFMYGNKLAIMALSGNVFGLVVESALVTESMMHIFNILWSVAEEETV